MFAFKFIWYWKQSKTFVQKKLNQTTHQHGLQGFDECDSNQ